MIETKCAYCGKMFIKAPQHSLVDGKNAYCKPTCFLHRNDGKKKPCGRGRKGRRVAQYTKDGELVKAYNGANEAAESFWCVAKTIRDYIYQGKPYGGFLWKFLD